MKLRSPTTVRRSPCPTGAPDRPNRAKPCARSCTPSAPIPLWLASGGPKNTELCAEVGDGWLPMALGSDSHLAPLERGWEKRGGRPDGFEIFTGLSVQLTDDVAGALDRMRPLTAMYVGGMGSASHNFHREGMARRGFPEEARQIQEHWLAGRKDQALAAVPDEYLEQTAFIGDEQRIRRRWATWTPPAGSPASSSTCPGWKSCAWWPPEGGIVNYETIVVDTPAEHVARITLNRPGEAQCHLDDACASSCSMHSAPMTTIPGCG